MACILGGLQAISSLAGDLGAVSTVYKTPPVGIGRQPPFYNVAVVLYPRMAAGKLLRTLKGIERAAGRSTLGRRWGPRVLDIDIIDYPGLLARLAAAEPSRRAIVAPPPARPRKGIRPRSHPRDFAALAASLPQTRATSAPATARGRPTRDPASRQPRQPRTSAQRRRRSPRCEVCAYVQALTWPQ